MLGALFLNPWMLFGGLAVAVPITIHILHRYRYKRVQWAAMDFLLDSQRRNRRRVLLEQLLLLALRCLLVLGIVAIVARPLGGESLAALLTQNQRSEHWVILDDSMSMGQKRGSEDCFAVATQALQTLVESLADRPGNHSLTLLRTSSYHTPDLLAARIDSTLIPRLRSLLTPWKAGFGSQTPASTVAEVAALIAKSDVSQRTVHLFSDFRAKDWPADGELTTAFQTLADTQARIQLLDAAPPEGSNLSIERIEGELGAVAAGVPFDLEASLHNQSAEAIGPVSVTAIVDSRPGPAFSVERIAASESAKARFTFNLPDAGDHSLTTTIPEDALSGDNTRYAVVAVPEKIPVLLIDGGADQADSRFLSLALAPGVTVHTGFEPIVRGPEALAGTTLSAFRVVILLNVARLEKPAIDALLRYVDNGGGLGIFVGDEVRPEQYNAKPATTGTIARQNEGAAQLLPVRLGSIIEASEPVGGPDIQFVAGHPVFRIFEGERNPFLGTVRIHKFYGLEHRKLPGDRVKVIASFRDGSPLALESSSGKGRILTFLTTAGPAWNNWARNPSYVVAMLEMVRYLAQSATDLPDNLVGVPWDIDYPVAEFRGELTLTSPNIEGGNDTTSLRAEPREATYRLSVKDMSVPGIYRVTLTGTDGATKDLQRAVNVDPKEGSLQKIDQALLSQRLEGIDYQFHAATELQADLRGTSFEPRDWLLYVFLLLLFTEQLLALRLSYHLR